MIFYKWKNRALTKSQLRVLFTKLKGGINKDE